MTKAETRIAVFYPWTGLPALDRGSSRRVVPLINLFGSHFGEVKVLSPGSPQRIAEANVEYLFHDPTAAERMLLRAAHYVYDGMLHHLSRGFITWTGSIGRS